MEEGYPTIDGTRRKQEKSVLGVKPKRSKINEFITLECEELKKAIKIHVHGTNTTKRKLRSKLMILRNFKLRMQKLLNDELKRLTSLKFTK